MEVRLSQRARWGAGQPISDLMSRALTDPEIISLAAGFVDDTTLPLQATQQAWESLWRDASQATRALQYGSTPGLPALRDDILERYVAPAEKAGASPVTLQQIVLTAGSNQFLHLIAGALLDPGDIVLTSAPTYFVFLGILGEMGARAHGVASDEEGMIPEALEESLRYLDREGSLPRVRLIYLVPYFDNPTGATLPFARRQELVEIARRWSRHQRIPIIADDAYRELRYDGEDIPSMRCADEKGELVIEAGTFSKSFSPGIRVGWGVLPAELVEPVLHLKGNYDFGSAQLNQHLMHRVLESGMLDEHVVRLRRSYRQKRDAMLVSLEKHFQGVEGVSWRRPVSGLSSGGLYVWLTVPSRLDTSPLGPLWDIAVREGVLYVPGHYCYPAEGAPTRRNEMRLSFGVQSSGGIERGIAALARAVRDVLASTP